VRILADIGYDGIALTPDVHHLDPLRASPADIAAFRAELDAHGLAVVIETGARFVLDPEHKHRPSLLDERPGAERRLAFLVRCVDLAVEIGAPIVTVWSGSGPDGLPEAHASERLVGGLRELCAHAERRGVRIGFEPEPGMAIETVAQWHTVRDAVASGTLGLTLDVGHCLATREGDPAALIEENAEDLLVIQLDDHVPGIHDHLAFGEGEVDFAAIAAAVKRIGFTGPLEVELSRHSSTAPSTARDALNFLKYSESPADAPGSRQRPRM
jgi:sugar phosphate isomerase/epimerase